jgi:hypothetical protein
MHKAQSGVYKRRKGNSKNVARLLCGYRVRRFVIRIETIPAILLILHSAEKFGGTRKEKKVAIEQKHPIALKIVSKIEKLWCQMVGLSKLVAERIPGENSFNLCVGLHARNDACGWKMIKQRRDLPGAKCAISMDTEAVLAAGGLIERFQRPYKIQPILR